MFVPRKTEKLHLRYHERSGGKYRDLRSFEYRFGSGRRRFVRVSLNGQYRTSKREKAFTRHANPGWAFGFNRAFVELIRHRHHCFHLGFNVARRGVTFSGGRRLI